MPSENNHSPGLDAVAREIPVAPVFGGNDAAWLELIARSEAAASDLLASPEYASQQEALQQLAQQQADALQRLLENTYPALAMPRSQDLGDGVRGPQQDDTSP